MVWMNGDLAAVIGFGLDKNLLFCGMSEVSRMT